MEIPCNVGGSPEPEITWYRDSVPLENIGAVRYNIKENGSLVINSVAGSDGGRYTCTATNRRGLSSSSTATIRVIGRLVCQH